MVDRQSIIHMYRVQGLGKNEITRITGNSFHTVDKIIRSYEEAPNAEITYSISWKLKIKQKISRIFRSDSEADAFFAIHYIADTAWKNSQSQLNAISAILSL